MFSIIKKHKILVVICFICFVYVIFFSRIYYRYHDYDAEMEWLDEKTVEINGKKLNIHKDYYKG